MSGARQWTKEEDERLAEAWGSVSIGSIARKLGRSVNGVKLRASRLGLGPWLMGGDYVTLNQLVKALGYNQITKCMIHSWVEVRGMPVHKRLVERCRFRVVYLDEFWAWAKENRTHIDFSRMEPLALGAEPDWVPEQRRKDQRARTIQRKDAWTHDEDLLLESMVNAQRYSWLEISRIMRRSCGAIAMRCQQLGLRARPVMASAHSVWTEEAVRILEDGILSGDSYGMIALAVGKSEKAVRGYVARVYGTEREDVVRGMISKGA